MIRYVLFDLDGTLLPMDYDQFVKKYFGELATINLVEGVTVEDGVQCIKDLVKAMMISDGSLTNEDTTYNVMKKTYGDRIDEVLKRDYEYYEGAFDEVKITCGYNKMADETVKLTKKLGMIPVLASSPLFPRVATYKRAAWAGLDREDFTEITTYEDYHFAKPNPGYYKELLNKLGAKPEECLMVGNDVDEDMVAEKLGMKVFLVTDCLLNKSNKDIKSYPQGGFKELQEFIKTIKNS